jgi:hypothetical protein
MKEIKFRAWQNASKRMVSEEKVNTFLFNAFKYNGDSSGCTFMQFTGLHDKNGTPIYEGDICTIWMGVKQTNPYIVEDLRELYLEMNRDDGYLRITDIEVIGNIYSNPELLKEEVK